MTRLFVILVLAGAVVGGAAKASLKTDPLIGSCDDGVEHLLVVSDDGTLRIRGEECKKLKDTNLRRFRVASVPLRELMGKAVTAQVVQ